LVTFFVFVFGFKSFFAFLPPLPLTALSLSPVVPALRFGVENAVGTGFAGGSEAVSASSKVIT